MSAFENEVSDWITVNGEYLRTIKADINAALAGANVIVAAPPATKIIRVFQYVIVCSNIVSVAWESSGGTVLGGPMAFCQNGEQHHLGILRGT